MARLTRTWCSFSMIAVLTVGAGGRLSAKAPTAAQALHLKPTQKGVIFDEPSAAEVAKCAISAEKSQHRTAWVVRDGNGQILREFADTNGDNVVDQWSYYLAGLEVYREADANFNGKADQCRWLSTAGTRWGVDTNEDGTIDSWQMISAEEVAEEVVIAVRDNDAGRFQALLLNDKELENLEVGSDHRAEIAKRLAEASDAFRRVVADLGPRRVQLDFLDFGGTKPSLIPAGSAGTSKDLIVYENTAALAATEKEHEQLVLGTLVKLGDAWKLVAGPMLAGGQQAAATGLFFTPNLQDRPDPQVAQLTSIGGPSEAEQKLLVALEQLDNKIASAPPQQRPQINQERFKVLRELAQAASGDQRNLWLRQLADMISAEVQAGLLPNGIKELEALQVELKEASAAKDLIAHVDFLTLAAQYSQDLQSPNADFVKIQQKWLEDLESFVKRYPESPETADALIQLGMAEEFAGNSERAETWYATVTKDFRDTDSAKKAAGAMRRLGIIGKPMVLRGTAASGAGTIDISQLRGKVVLIQYWATWCEPCLADMARLREIYDQYKRQGFEIVGVNLDNDSQQLAGYLQRSPVQWQQIHEPGGLDSPPAVEMGVMTLPQMVLVDQQGRVINRNVHVAELSGELARLLK